jgi:hypothetical protein
MNETTYRGQTGVLDQGKQQLLEDGLGNEKNKINNSNYCVFYNIFLHIWI